MTVSVERMKRKYSQDNEARRRSREVIGKIPGVRVIPDESRKPPKHRKPVSTGSYGILK